MAVVTDIAPLPAAIAHAVESLKQNAEAGALEVSEWDEVANAGKTLADSLRSEELRTSTGETGVLDACGALLRKIATKREADETTTQTSTGAILRAQTELTRTVGNLCFDHDGNRQRTLDAGIPLALAGLLSSILGCDEGPTRIASNSPRELSLEEVKFVRATTGAFLNSSLKFDPMRRELARKEGLQSLLALLDFRQPSTRRVSPIYQIGEWAGTGGERTSENLEERRDAASTAVRWAANVLEDVLAEDKSAFPDAGVAILASSVLNLETPQPNLPHSSEPEDVEDWIDTDIELLTISASLLEGIVLDSDEAKSRLAFSPADAGSSAAQESLLSRLLDFVETAKTPASWTEWTEDPARVEKAFSAIKASVVRAIVEAPNSDEVMERLWSETRLSSGDGTEAEFRHSKSWLVERLVQWLRRSEIDDGREDLLICAAHMLASLGRRDEYTLSLVRYYGLAEPLARIVRERVAGAIGKTGRPGETTQILFGVVSLLRHLAIPPPNREVIGGTGIAPVLTQLLRPELDVVQPLQLAAVGLLKHLCYPSARNALSLFGDLHDEEAQSSAPTHSTDPAPVDLVIELMRRVDDVRLRSESARIVVNLIRTLFGSATSLVLDHLLDSPTSSVKANDNATETDASRLLRAEPPAAAHEAGAVTAADAVAELFAKSDSPSIPPEMLANAASLLLAILLAVPSSDPRRVALGDQLKEPIHQALKRVGRQVWSETAEKVLAELSVE
ncbi:hypothetical protein JCM10908_002098 [Rhodotorula pacifica]|uniref:uncharacterized protein n=1 Tax=Rhodotorula pacifica TaxID=1495444 RepID=UPI00316D3F34